MSEKYHYNTITAALPYANGPLHIGHLGGVYIPTDIYVRYLRRKEKDVIFICGSDEHGVPITLRSKKECISTQEVVDKYHSIIKECLEKFNISFDHFSRTSSSIHHKTVSSFFKELYHKDLIIEEESKQFYDEKEGQFLADRYILGVCPYCKNTKAFGDQCERCGIYLSPNELISPRSALSGISPILKETFHWFLPLPNYEAFLKQCISKKFWKTNVYSQYKSWIEGGLKPRSITRDLNWGIPVPIKEIENKVLYVWFDAPIGYISSTIEWAINNKKNWKIFWKNKCTSLINFIGKDNIVFHCIIFPVMLIAHGDYILPRNIHANEFLNLENKKISTSRNWAVWLHAYLEEFPNQQDVLRYILITKMPENKDNNFNWKDFQIQNNSELVGILGNFIHRTLILTKKFFFGIVPSPSTLREKDRKVIKTLQLIPDNIGSLIENYHFKQALNEFMKIARMGNKYISEEAPWKRHKHDYMRTKTILYISLQISGMLTQLSGPFLPRTSERMMKMLRIKALPWKLLKKKNYSYLMIH
ncbi:methionine-tRNA ligase [Candidatus Uzinura diaspidicola str. ASNER]|uniref:Methionine--tRNA ligase n=1 Tax=Candidatus Uzinura diaspidicola str. ASNER TaxID=1133592 RepID=L7VJF1_9FLAO|nr:methionine-tRNA ligase [Candidatus Uzinura diaspidicola str. ASNER]